MDWLKESRTLRRFAEIAVGGNRGTPETTIDMPESLQSRLKAAALPRRTLR